MSPPTYFTQLFKQSPVPCLGELSTSKFFEQAQVSCLVHNSLFNFLEQAPVPRLDQLYSFNFLSRHKFRASIDFLYSTSFEQAPVPCLDNSSSTSLSRHRFRVPFNFSVQLFHSTFSSRHKYLVLINFLHSTSLSRHQYLVLDQLSSSNFLEQARLPYSLYCALLSAMATQMKDYTKKFHLADLVRYQMILGGDKIVYTGRDDTDCTITVSFL